MSDRTRRSGGAGILGCGGGALLAVVAVGGVGALLFRSCELTFATGDMGPGKGVDSARLPVEVTPRTGLIDGTVVTVSSDAFEPHAVVGVAVCLEAADSESAGVAACDEHTGARYAVSPEGKLSATYPVPRVITVQGKAHDCAAASTSCLVVAADAGDYDVSGGQRVGFRSDLGPTDLVVTTTRPHSDRLPALPPSFDAVGAGVVVEVMASGFQPGEPVLLAHCAGFPERAALDACEPVDDDAVGAIMGGTVAGVGRHADATGTARFSFTVLPTVDGFLSPDEPADCAELAARCAFVIAAAADTKRSAVVPYDVAR